MNLEEYRKALESDARTENEKLKKQIVSLQEENRQLNSDIRALSNRCFAITHGMFCPICKLENKFKCQKTLGQSQETTVDDLPQ